MTLGFASVCLRFDLGNFMWNSYKTYFIKNGELS